jgi:methanol--5-hydroxybenzimidazolylcobamide Co-methyltransferase
MPRYTTLAIDDPADLLFGRAPQPLTTRRGLVIGGGTVYPELNFTLPSIPVEESTLDQIDAHYRQIIQGATRRAAELAVPGLVVEFETLPPMTEFPDWGMRVVHVLLEGLQEASDQHGLKGVLRVTPNDNREFIRPPRLRDGRFHDAMLELFDRSAEAGAELLSIESVGGKELHDEALTMCDLPRVIFSLCVLGVADMRYVWTKIADIAATRGVHAAGDTACGFGNTAMVLAEQKMIPRSFAAVVRAVTAVRSLVAYECGAVGPGKDCGYENIILKAITGYPMAMEGKSATCAHLSPVGNVAAAAADTWSNESVQNIKLLGGMAPTCFLEALAYDCRLMNRAAADGPDAARTLRDWLVAGDVPHDPQAVVLTPASAVRLGRAIVSADDAYAAGQAVAREAVALIREAQDEGALKLPDREAVYLDMMDQSLDAMPDQVGAFIDEQAALTDPAVCDLSQYELSAAVTK